MGVGMPQTIRLQEFGEHVRRAFGHIPYHVGSSLTEKSGWRDVDVRLILDDAEYAAAGYGEPDREHQNPKWVSTILAWSAFGKALTDLPIDFQIQQRSHANAKYPHRRSALFSIPLMYEVEAQRTGAVDHYVKYQLTCATCGAAAYQPNDRCADHRSEAQKDKAHDPQAAAMSLEHHHSN